MWVWLGKLLRWGGCWWVWLSWGDGALRRVARVRLGARSEWWPEGERLFPSELGQGDARVLLHVLAWLNVEVGELSDQLGDLARTRGGVGSE